MANDTIKAVSEPTLRRLPLYHRLLKTAAQDGLEFSSCSFIGSMLNVEPTLVRKDLAVTGIVGKPKVGYEVKALVDAIEQFLGWRNITDAFLVGVGSLGTALLGYEKFNHYGFRIVAAFDNDPAKVGTEIHGRQVFDIDKLPDLADRMHILMGIITTPVEAAQPTAEIMVVSGIRAIWNLTPTSIKVPEGIIVQNEDIFASLAILSSKLEAALRGRPGKES